MKTTLFAAASLAAVLALGACAEENAVEDETTMEDSAEDAADAMEDAADDAADDMEDAADDAADSMDELNDDLTYEDEMDSKCIGIRASSGYRRTFSSPGGAGNLSILDVGSCHNGPNIEDRRPIWQRW